MTGRDTRPPASGDAATPACRLAAPPPMLSLSTAIGGQEPVIAFLADPATHGLAAGAVEVVQTHCSIVFLAGDRAYKLKRAIRYAALDYTTPELRHAACRAELQLNRRTAPDLYLDVAAITRAADGALAFNGPDAPIEHVVVMRRFAQSDLFESLADTGRLTPELMRALGTQVAQFHRAAAVVPALGGSDALRRDIASNDRELAKVAAALDGAAVDRLSRACHASLDVLAPLLDRRRREGKVRRCHGDLRLANLCLYQGQPTLFDCIEFSAEVGCIDVLYDLAFLLMDLQLRGRGDLGNAVFNAYLDAAPETDGLRALPLFLALRAATRSYALAGSAQRQDSPRQAARRLAQARRHIAAGLAFLTPAPPRLLLVGGAGPGRRRLAEAIAGLVPPVPGARVLRHAAEAWGQVRAVLQAGCPVVIEAPFIAASERRMAQQHAARLGLTCSGLWLGWVPDGLDHDVWQVLDASAGACATLVAAARRLRLEPMADAGA